MLNGVLLPAAMRSPDLDMIPFDSTRRVARNAGELHGGGGGERSEVPVAHQVEGADGSVERGGDDRVAASDVAEIGHCGRVLGEGHVAEARSHAPELDFAVVAAGGHDAAVRRELQRADAVIMALLLEHVGLGLPLPDEQLAERGAAESEPVAGAIDGAGGDAAVGDGERVDEIEVGHLVEGEDAVGEADDEEMGARIEVAASGGVGFAEVVAIFDGPLAVRVDAGGELGLGFIF